jgi:uncharacterized membrane protein
MSTETPPTAPVVEDRTVAILSYITIIGFIIAIVMHNGKKTALGAFHLRQVLGMFVTGVVAIIPCMVIAVIPFVNLLMIVIWPVLMIGFFVLWIMGLIAGAKGEKKPVPVLGEHYQKWFAGAFA